MISESLDHFFSFILDVCVELFVGWVLSLAYNHNEKAYKSTTKHEILPDKNTSFITSASISSFPRMVLTRKEPDARRYLLPRLSAYSDFHLPIAGPKLCTSPE